MLRSTKRKNVNLNFGFFTLPYHYREAERNIKKWEAKRYNWSVQKFEQSIKSKAVVYSTYRIHVTLAKEGEKSAEDYFVKTKIYMDNAERLLKEAMSDFLCTKLVDDDCCTKSEQASIEDVL
ncbi:hypothetical protein DdX_13790 [Ditylenchus destructor]|uniref:Uncharacterized protein n=1 Tax=Ditylenchus destructor TaxID=166010 RepID=A0AAD4MY84_9BILA|nr:hypothetical protein DdX_13790 [Ditylenchus destructor]